MPRPLFGGLDINLKIQELEKKNGQESRPERTSMNLGQEVRNTIIYAVNEGVEKSVGSAVGRAVTRTQCQALNSQTPTPGYHPEHCISVT